MKRIRKTYNLFQLSSAVFMVLTLLWLTVSLPFVYASQQQQDKIAKAASSSTPADSSEEEAGNPFGNTTEEKNPNSFSSFSEEYLHHHHIEEYFFSVASQYHTCEGASTYIAFHGEVQVPPPNAA